MFNVLEILRFVINDIRFFLARYSDMLVAWQAESLWNVSDIFGNARGNAVSI